MMQRSTVEDAANDDMLDQSVEVASRAAGVEDSNHSRHITKPVRGDHVYRQGRNTGQDGWMGPTLTSTHPLYHFPIVPDGTTQNHAEDHSYDLQ